MVIQRPGATKTRRGGRNQRVAKANKEKATQVESKLALSLLYNVSWSIFTPQLAQEIAGLAVADFQEASKFGSSLPRLEKIAAAGTGGKHTNNIST